MKKILCFMALTAIMALSSSAMAQGGCTDYTSVPYTTGFEGLSTGQLPSCWQQIQTGSSGSGTFPSAYVWSNSRTGSVYFEFESNSGQTEIAALPLMQNISSLKLTFWASLMNHNFVLEVGVMEDSLFVPVDTVDNLIVGSGGNWHGSYHEYTVYFNEYYGSGERMAMRVTASGSYTLMLDDLTVSEDNGCYPLSNLTLTAADSESITLSWVDDMNVGATYTVTYWKDGGDTVSMSNVTDTFYTANSLDASSNYHFIVTPNCSTGDGIPVTGDFRTTCGVLMVPFLESFESAAALECWSKVACASSTGQSSSNGHTGSGSFRFYYNTNPPQTLITPPLGGTESDGILLSFWYKKYINSYTENFKVGYSTTTADPSAFTWGSVVTPTTNYEEFTAVYPAGVKYLAIQYLQNNGYYLYIDDFNVSIDNGCNKPNDAYIDSVGPYDAYLRWTSGGASAASYNIYYNTTNSLTGATEVSGVSDTTYAVTGLLPQTTYYAWVRTDCGSDSLDIKPFGSFTTQLTCAQLTGVTMSDINYTAAVVNWNYNTSVGFPSTEVIITLTDNSDTSVAPVTVTTTGTSYTFTSLEAGHSYTAALRNICDVLGSTDTAANNTISFMTTSCSEIESDNTTNQYIPTYTLYNYSYSQAIYPASQMPAIDSIHGVAFNVTSASASGNVRTWDIYIGHTSTATFSGEYSWIPVSGMTRVAHNVSVDASTTGWKVITFDSVFFYNGDSNLVIAIDDNTGSWKSSPSWASINASGQGISFYSDGVNYDPASPSYGTVRNSIPAVRFVADCDVPTCFAPIVVVDSIAEDAVSLHWTSVGIENSWLVGIKVDGAANYTYASGAVTDTFYTFTGLNSNTEYSIVVGSLCTDTLNTVVSVHTNCGITSVPYSTGFEGFSRGDLPNCWMAIQTGTSGSGIFPSIYNHSNALSGNGYFEFESNAGHTEVAALPVMDSISSLMLTFYASLMNHNFTLEAGVMEGNTFVPVDTIDNLIVGSGGNWHGSYHEYDVVFSNYTGTGNRIALRVTATGSYTLMMDDFSVAYNTGCQRPAAAVVDSVSGSDVNLHWTSTSAGSYEVGYATVNDVTDSSLQTVTVSDTAATILGLDPMTQYFFWVRALCGTAASSWRDAGSASTGCDTVTCNVTIQMVDSYGDGWNGNAIYVYQAGVQVGNATISTGSTGTANISVCSSAPVEFRYHSGNFAYEASVTIFDGGGAALVSGVGLDTYSDGAIIATSTNPCPSCITPSNLVATSVTETSITVNWTDPVSSQWEVWFDGVYVGDVTTPSYTFNGLSSSTVYTVSVRAICGAGDTSAFATASISTTCGEISTFPWVEGFETADVLECWNQEGNGSWTVGTGDYSSSTGAHSGTSNAMILHSSSGNVTKLISPVLALSTGSQATLSFWHVQRSWSGDQDSMVVYYRTSMTDTWHRLMGFHNEIASWTKDSVDLPNTTSTYQICFEMHDDYGYGVAIDDITVDGMAGGCSAPVVSNVVTDVESITVSYVATGIVEVAIVEGNVTNPPATTDTATGNSYNFTGLMPSTLYTIFLRQHCTDSTSSDWTSVTATTEDLGCVPPTNLNVQGIGYTSVTFGWTVGNEETAWQIHVFNLTFDSIYTVGTNPVVITGFIPAVTYNACIRSLCGVNSDLPGEWGEDTVTFTTEICPDVEGLVVTNVTAHSADVSWSATTGVSGYNVLWFMEDAEQGNVTVQNPTYHLDGLEAEMPYRVLVKNICTEGAMSEHWASVEFNTPAGGSEGIDEVAGAVLSLYPNPANNVVNVSLEGFDGGATVEVVDMNGRVCGKWMAEGNTLTIDLTHMVAGAYFVRVTSSTATAVGRLLVR